MQIVKLKDCIGTNGIFCDGDWVESKDQDPNGDIRLIQLADIGMRKYKDASSRFMTTHKFNSGATPRGGKANYKNEGISLIRSMNVHNNKFKYLDLAHIDEAQAENLDNVTVQDIDVLINITGASVVPAALS